MVLEVQSVGSTIHLYGVTGHGNTLHCEVTNFYPHIYVRPFITEHGGSRREIKESDLTHLRATLEAELQSSRAAKTLSKNAAAAEKAATATSSTPAASSLGTPKKGVESKKTSRKGGRAASPTAAASASSSFFAKKTATSKKSTLHDGDDEEEDDDDGGDHGDGGMDDDFMAEEDEEDEEPVKGACIVAMKLVQKKSLMYYRGDSNETFVQIWLSNPSLCTAAHQLLSKDAKLTVKNGSHASSSSSSTLACSTCTLVNSSDRTTCSACDSALAPTSSTHATTPSSVAYTFAGEVYGSNIGQILGMNIVDQVKVLIYLSDSPMFLSVLVFVCHLFQSIFFVSWLPLILSAVVGVPFVSTIVWPMPVRLTFVHGARSSCDVNGCRPSWKMSARVSDPSSDDRTIRTTFDRRRSHPCVRSVSTYKSRRATMSRRMRRSIPSSQLHRPLGGSARVRYKHCRQ